MSNTPVAFLLNLRVVAVAIFLLLPQVAIAEEVLLCQVDGSDDQFIFYPHMLVQKSERFDVYVLMGGVTVAVVERDTGRFNRLTNLNLLDHSEKVQFFQGRCRPAPYPQ